MQCSIVLNRMSASVTTEFLALQKNEMESLWGKKNVESMHPNIESQLWTQMPTKTQLATDLYPPSTFPFNATFFLVTLRYHFLPSEYRFQYLNSADTKHRSDAVILTAVYYELIN